MFVRRLPGWLYVGLALSLVLMWATDVWGQEVPAQMSQLPEAAKKGMGYLAHFMVGTGVAFLASLPLGPVNLAVIQASLNHNRGVALSIAFGSALVELFYCLVAVGGVELLFDDALALRIIQIISVPILVGIGLYNLFKKMPQLAPEEVVVKKPRSRRTSFFLGMSLNFLNPLLLPFWITMTAWLRGHNLLVPDTSHLVLFSAGVAVGTFLLLVLVAYLGSRFKGLLSHHAQKVINRVIGALFLCSALIVSYLVWLRPQ